MIYHISIHTYVCVESINFVKYAYFLQQFEKLFLLMILFSCPLISGKGARYISDIRFQFIIKSSRVKYKKESPIFSRNMCNLDYSAKAHFHQN